MFIFIEINNQRYKINSAEPLDISIPMEFYGAQPNAYGVAKAVSKPCEAENLVGDTRRGGSCNFEQVTLIPHCNGTHTECVGHITNERISVRDCLRDVFIPAVVISVEPENAASSDENYSIQFAKDDKLITKKAIENKISNFKFQISNLYSLIVRTLPNSESKLRSTYLENIPPFFSTEAMQYISELGVKHLLVDLPSIDRIFDEGKLANHRTFWNVKKGSFETNRESRINNTITELIYVPSKIEDGEYLLNLQIAPFVADASPSRPILFRVVE